MGGVGGVGGVGGRWEAASASKHTFQSLLCSFDVRLLS